MYWFKFMFDGRLIRQSTKQGNDKVAQQLEAAERTRLAKEHDERKAAIQKLKCTEVRRCPDCGSWFDAAITIRDAVSDQQFCSSYCRDSWSKKRRSVPTLFAFYKNRVEPWARVRPSWMWYRSGIRPLSTHNLANVNLDTITTETIADYAAHRQSVRLVPATINRELRVLRRLLRLAVEWGVLEKAPRVQMLRGEKRRERVVGEDEFAAYLTCAIPLLTAVATTLYDTGMRPDECHRARWDEISWTAGRYGTLLVSEGKTAAARRVIPLTPRVSESPVGSRWKTVRRIRLALCHQQRPHQSLHAQETTRSWEFVEQTFLPQIKILVRESTYAGYSSRWESQLKPRCGDIRLDEFESLNAQQTINEIARQNSQMRHSTLAHFKNLLSLIFDEAERLGFMPQGRNPARLVRLPKASKERNAPAYSLPEIETLISVLPRPANVVVATAAFAGLRRAELRGLEWPDYDGQKLAVNRSVWEGFENEPKTLRSKAAVPVISRLRILLNMHRLECGNPTKGPIFRNAKGRPMNLNNLLNRVILPALNACVNCGKQKAEHAGANHDYQRNEKIPRWRGFHAFRRGLASTLYGLGVDDLMIQAVLRHKDVIVTREHYIQTTAAQTEAAMSKLEAVVGVKIQ